MRTASEFLQNNRYTGKPDVGYRPSIDDQINALRSKRRYIDNEMKGLAQIMKRPNPEFNEKNFSRFQELNEQLRDVKIEEANITYFRNKL